MEKEIDFKSDFDLEAKVYDIEDINPKEDLGVEEIEELPDIETEEQLEVTLKKKREAMRERLAIVFIIGMFLILIIAIVVGYLSGQDQVKNITDLVLAISGILSAPLGFIIGYYFKSQEEEKNR